MMMMMRMMVMMMMIMITMMTMMLSRTEMEVGDILVVHHEAVSHSRARDLVSRIPGLKIPGSASVSRSALLVWPVTAEVDPWVYYTRPAPDTLR